MENKFNIVNRLERIVAVFVTISMITITLVSFIQVLARHLDFFSVGGIEELPTYMLIIAVWLAAAVNVKNDDAITINLFELFIKNKSVIKKINIITDFLSAIALSILTVLVFQSALYNMTNNYQTAGLKIPYWIIFGIVGLCCMFMAIFYFVNGFNKIKEG